MRDPIFQEEDSQLYIRPKPGGGRVFRVTLRADQQRLDMTYLTQVSLPDGRLHDRGATRPTPDERAQIADWVAAQNGAGSSAAKRRTRDAGGGRMAGHNCDPS